MYRQEHFGHSLLKHAYKYEDNFRNAFPNFNKILFQSAVDNKASVNSKLFKLLLSDNQFRNKRDLHLKKLTDLSDKILSKLKKIYTENEKIILHSKISRRTILIKQKEQIKLFKTIVAKARRYLEYGDIHDSYDYLNKKLFLMSDVFFLFKMNYPPTDYTQVYINGIGFDIDLDFKHNYKTFDINIDNFKLGKLIFINMVTEDTIPNNKIHINESILKPRFEKKTPLKSKNSYYSIFK